MRKQMLVGGLGLLLGACSGGGSTPGADSSDANLVKIDSTNAETVAMQSYGLIESSLGSASSFGGTSTFSVGGSSVGYVKQLTDSALSGVGLPSAQVKSVAIAMQAKETLSESEDCEVSGRRTVEVVNLDDGTIDPGDRMKLTASQCNDGDVTINGSMEIIVNRYDSQDNNNITVRFDLTGTSDGSLVTIRGDFTGDEKKIGSTTTETTTSERLYVAVDDESVTFENLSSIETTDGSDYSVDYDVTLISDLVGGKVKVSTDPVFTGRVSYYSSYPDYGVMTVTGADSSYVKLDADTGNRATAYITYSSGGGVSSETVYWRNL